MKRYGPDSFESWVISISCCFINMMMFGMFRLSGVLFVASTSRFNVSRNMASFPYTFASFVRNISGPLVGFLGHRYGVRAVTTIGCLLGTIGTGACYFAENIATVTVLWGATFGFGFGLGSILLPLSINQYFDKHRATASGISFSGACFGSFVLPPLVEIFIETYGLSGTYLLLSGFILNCIPAALLLRKPTFDIKTKARLNKIRKQYGIEIIESVTNVYSVQNVRQKLQAVPRDNMEANTLQKMSNKEKDECILDRNMERLLIEVPVDDFSACKRTLDTSNDNEGQIRTSGGNKTVGINPHNHGCLDLNHHNSENEVTSGKCDVLDHNYQFSNVYYARPEIWTDKNSLPSSKNIICSNSFNEKEGHINYGFNECIGELKLNHDLEIPLDMINTENASDMSSVSSRISLNYSVNSLHQQNGDIIHFSSSEKKNTISKNVSQSTKGSKLENLPQTTLTTQVKNNSKTEQQESMGFSNIICNPMFNLITITNGIYCFTFVSIVTVVVDFARDQEVGQSNEKYVIMSLSLGGLIGRLALGWITDRSYMTTTAFAGLCFAVQGISIAALVWSNDFVPLIILLTLYGLSEAGIMVIYPIIISQYIDKDKQTVAIPSSNFLSGPLCLAVAPMIGYFRDEVGTYDYILYGLSVLSAACSLFMLLAPKITRCENGSRDSDISL